MKKGLLAMLLVLAMVVGMLFVPAVAKAESAEEICLNREVCVDPEEDPYELLKRTWEPYCTIIHPGLCLA